MTPIIPTSRSLILLGALAGSVACSDSEIPNYNNPVLPAVVSGSAALQSQATGIAAGDRENHAFQILILETMGRDAYRIDAADPRYINNPLGQFNPSAFVTNFLWNSHYRTIRSANELVSGVEAADFSAADKAGARGYARTLKANQYLRLIEMRDTVGIPIALGQGALDPIRCKPAVLAYISALLDSAAIDRTLCLEPRAFRARPDVQADARHPALRAGPARPVALPTPAHRRRCVTSAGTEISR